MYLIVIAWTYVTLMMAVAEATSPAGSLLGAIVTFMLYGLLPMGILVYILGTPGRKRAIKAREAAEQAAFDAQRAEQRQAESAPQPPAQGPTALAAPPAPAAPSVAPDAGSQAPAAAQASGVAPVRKEP